MSGERKIRPFDPSRYADALDTPSTVGAEALLARIEEAGLRGRGGAGFPVAAKLRAVRAYDGTRIVVANGEEGEPGSIKDRTLLRTRPDLVIAGLAVAARIVGATRGYVYASDDAGLAAVANFLDRTPGSLEIELALVPHSYVAGESSAVVRYLEGGPALPTAKPPRPYERGYLISNVESLAQLAVLAADAGSVAPLITPSSIPGSRIPGSLIPGSLITVSGGDLPAMLYEVPAGTTLGALAQAHGLQQFVAALPSGMFGGIVGTEAADRDLGSAGQVRFLRAGECPVAVVAAALRFLGAESSRQCGICVMGTSSLDGTVAALAAGTCQRDDVAKLAARAAKLPGRGACGLLDAAASMADALLTRFPADVERHLLGGCPGCEVLPDLHVPMPAPPADTANPLATAPATPALLEGIR